MYVIYYKIKYYIQKWLFNNMCSFKGNWKAALALSENEFGTPDLEHELDQVGKAHDQLEEK